MYTQQSALSPLSQRARVRPQPALASCLSIGLLLLLAVTNVFAQARAAQFRQMEAEQARTQRLRAEVPNLPFSIARGGDVSESTSGEREKASLAGASLAGGVPPKWNQLAGPEAGTITSLFEKNGRIFAGTLGGIYFSDDQGLSWQRSFGSPAKFVSFAIVSLGDALFFGSDAAGLGQPDPGGVWRSLDNGLTWEHINNGLPDTVGVLHLALLKNNTLLASTQGGFVFRSTDNGDTWTAAQNGLPDKLGYFFMAGSSRAIIATTAQGVFRSTDGGLNWQDISGNLPAGTQLTPLEYPTALGDSFILWAGTGGVLISDDDGATWRASNQGLPAHAFVGNVAAYGNDLFASLADGALYRSADRGASWVKQSDDFAFGKTVYAALKTGTTLLVGTGDGVYRSEDDGRNWLRSNDGLRNAYVDGGIMAVNNRLFVAAASGVWASDTKGATWYLVNRGFRQYPFTSINGSSLGIKDGVLYAGSFGDGLYRSFDGGGSWERVGNGLPERWAPAAIKVFNGKIYAANWFGGAFVSEDDGATWQSVNGLPADTSFLCLAQMHPGHLLAGAYPGGVFRSDDDGKTWYAFQTGVRNEFIDDFLVNNTTIIVGTDDGIYRMNEDESGWSEILYYKENVRGGVNSFIRQGKAIYASTFGRGIVVSYNNGETWGPFNQGITTLRGFYFAEIKGDLYFGSGGAGVWAMRSTVKTPPIIPPPPDEPPDDESGDPFNDN